MSRTTEELPLLDVTSVAQGGDGVARDESGRVVFIPRTLPGERIKAKYTRQKRSFARAVISEIVTPSPDRVEPGCEHFDRCGACDFWHTSYEVAWGLKASAAQDTVRRLSKLEMPDAERVASPSPQNYRTRATVRFVRTHRGMLMGFLERGGHRIVAIPRCKVLVPELSASLERCRAALKTPRRGELFVETSGRGGAIVTVRNVTLTREERVRFLSELAGLATMDGIDGVRFEQHVYGEPEVDLAEAVAFAPPVEVRVPSGLFRQAHGELNKALVAWVRDRVQEQDARSALELYSGSGNFSWALAPVLDRLTCVEGSEDAVSAAQRIASAAGWEHVESEVSDLEIPDMALFQEAYDVVVLDPPREGARAVCEALVEEDAIKPESVIYISCDPACLGRDLAVLAQGGYEVASWSIFDMFPWTSHVETVVYLERNSS